MRPLPRGSSDSVDLRVFAGQVALLLVSLSAPVPVSCQEPEGDTADALGAQAYLRLPDTTAARLRDSSRFDGWGRFANGFEHPVLDPQGWPPSIQEAPGPHPHTMVGLATGITVAAVAVPLSLGASTCFGSGDYLLLCRIVFVGATAVGGGLGALVGRMVKTEGLPGRATTIMVGSALGAVGAFLVSLPVCGQEEADNPDLLCGYDGMIEPGTVVGAAVVGGVLGYLLRGSSESLAVSQLGPVPTPAGRSALAVAFTLSR